MDAGVDEVRVAAVRERAGDDDDASRQCTDKS
jgi:hypothetical protein